MNGRALMLQFLYLFSVLNHFESAAVNSEKSIVIIGSGPSGIAAATRLLSNGFKNVTILEAENRFGGRINTIQYGANVLDMGAQWCHGEVGNVVYEMAKGKDLLSTHVVDVSVGNLFRSNGEAIPKEIASKLNAVGHGIDSGFSEEQIVYNGSMGNFFADKYWAALQGDDFKDVDDELKHQAFEYYHGSQRTNDGCDNWYELSCRSSNDWEDSPGDYLLNWKDKGFVTVFDLLQNKIPSGNDSQNTVDVLPYIQLNKEVQKINYKEALTANAPIHIETSDGSIYNADHVICTVSLGVLQHRHLSLFEPLLPSRKINSIDGRALGTVDKLFAEYDAPFWHDQWEGFGMLWLPEQLKVVREDAINGDWLGGIIGFYRVSYQPNILCGWITGPEARNMERKSDEDVKRGVDKVMKMFLSKKFTVPDTKSVKRSQWFSNPHFRGSYSYYTLKSDAVGATTSQLAEPIESENGIPVVQFAGEATSKHYFSSVHGAIETGWREAERLIDTYKGKI
ncbi:spermine oxidase-like [Bradysia coprophila]|uniref:spermine oxidase-like n=1 Tax=Bradysia coprophila TaxID=38358 RepID=UPI00187D8A8E|nr:spermine oxidase-like [Bradysia coprophila]